MTTRPPIDATAPVLAFESQSSTQSNPIENFGEWLAREAADLGVPVAVIAREANVDRTTIYRWKKAHHAPYLRSADRIRFVVDGYWDRVGGRGRRSA